jgi:acetyl-CoA synthetase
MAEKTGVTVAEYQNFESGSADFHFTFIYKCALLFGVEITDLMEGLSARLHSYTVTRAGQGQLTVKENGIEIRNLAPLFHNKIAEPNWVRYAYNPAEQNSPIQLTTHGGQEFDFILSGKLKVQVGEHTVVLGAGDSIYYDSGTPHGMIAVDGQECVFCAVVLPGEEAVAEERFRVEPKRAAAPVVAQQPPLYESFIRVTEDEAGSLQAISFINEEKFNFAFDVVDAMAAKTPDKLAMLHISRDLEERNLTFGEMSRESARVANYFRSLGIRKGDRVMLVLKRHHQFWLSILALHKLGAVAIPATHLLLAHDFDYRFRAAEVKAIICTADGDVAQQAELAMADYDGVTIRALVGGQREGWHDFDEEYPLFSETFERKEDTACGDDLMLMFFTSGTTGYPKIAAHNYKYPLGHFITAKYWHCVNPEGIHFTISDTGWGKAMWGKLYGQWLCEAAVFYLRF